MEPGTTSVFVTHTEAECPGQQCERATIACSLQDQKIVYGISVCCEGDNFSRKRGRELAQQRMEQGYGTYELHANDFYVTGKTPNEAVALFALNLRRAVAKNYNRYKRKLHDFRTNKTTSTAGAAQ